MDLHEGSRPALSPDEAHQAMRLAELEWRGLGGSAEADRLRRALALW